VQVDLYLARPRCTARGTGAYPQNQDVPDPHSGRERKQPPPLPLRNGWTANQTVQRVFFASRILKLFFLRNEEEEKTCEVLTMKEFASRDSE
jgi:hypothetical protein